MIVKHIYPRSTFRGKKNAEPQPRVPPENLYSVDMTITLSAPDDNVMDP
jgi:hypothetical protein